MITDWVLWVGFGLVGVIAGWVLRGLWARRRSALPGPVVPSGPSATSGAVSSAAPTAGPDTRRVEAPRAANVALASRVIIHLGSLGRLGNDEIARVGYTQRGMASALGAGQGGIAKVLSRLEAADVVVVDRRHVAGERNRLKVYRLTALGESVTCGTGRRGRPAPIDVRVPTLDGTPDPVNTATLTKQTRSPRGCAVSKKKVSAGLQELESA